MAQFRIKGQQSIAGEVMVLGAKNAALKAVAASLLSENPLRITNVPEIQDVQMMVRILEDIGAQVTRGDHELTIDTSGVKSGDLRVPSARKVRTTTLLIGPLLHRFGEVIMGYPGGCLLGRRPIDLFLAGFRALGVEIDEDDNEEFIFRCKRIAGGTFFFPFVSVTATEALMLAAVHGGGTTILKNAAMEPEIPALATYLNSQGARIEGAGTATITIQGVPQIDAGTFTLIPDRLEAGSFAILAAALAAPLTIHKCIPEHIESLLVLFDEMGIPYERNVDSIAIKSYNHTPKAVSVRTHEYPGFMTDLQAPFTVLLTQCAGMSLVHETVFEGRLFYVDLLNRMGANIILCDPHRAIVQGPTRLRGKAIESPDIRAGMAMVIAGLIAKGETTIGNIEQIDRGYERIDERLRAIGAQIERVV